jgi:hypothetical protein
MKIRYKSRRARTIFTASRRSMSFLERGSLQLVPYPYEEMSRAPKRPYDASATLPKSSAYGPPAAPNDNATVSPEDLAKFEDLQAASNRAKNALKPRFDLFTDRSFFPLTTDGMWWGRITEYNRMPQVEMSRMMPVQTDDPLKAAELDEKGEPKHFFATQAFKMSMSPDLFRGIVTNSQNITDRIAVADESLKSATQQVRLTMQSVMQKAFPLREEEFKAMKQRVSQQLLANATQPPPNIPVQYSALRNNGDGGGGGGDHASATKPHKQRTKPPSASQFNSALAAY